MESASQSQLPDVARRTDERIEVISGRGVEADEFEIYAPDASFIKLHFSKFHLPPGLVIEVSNPDGTESYRYSKNDLGPRTFDSRSGEDGRRSFSAMSISGDTAIVRVTGKRALLNRFEHRVLVDYYMEGIPADEVFASAVQSDTESAGTPGVPEPTSTCGANERYDAVCWEDSHPDEYDRSRPVAKLLIDGSKICSAWRVGPDNRMFTNNHCVYDQAKLDSTEVWFGYQKLECGGIQSTVPLKLTGNELFASDWFLDYTLFSINDFELVSDFGYLGLDIGDAQVGDGIYIPQHGLGRPKQIAIESDMNISGLCEVDADNETGHVAGADIGYFCDTVGGSSGSPVVGRSSHRAVALHHLGGCYNLAVKMSLIWPEVSEFFGGVVPVGDDESDTDTFPPFASFDFNCSGLSCDFDASGSFDDEGIIVSYSWGFGDGGAATGLNATHGYAEGGSYSVSLTVEDEAGNTDTETQVVAVDLPNESPTAALTANCVDMDCDFDAAGSSDSDGVITNYQWDFGDGSGVSGPASVVSHSYAVEGEYTVLLTVTDDDGAQASSSETVTVAPPPPENQAPVADFTHACVDLVCSFDASASHDPDGSIVEYSWGFGDGGSTQSASHLTEHTYLASGDYLVTLEVQDNLGATGTVMLSVFVPPEESEQGIELSVTGQKTRGRKSASLSWSGAESSEVDVLRDGAVLVTTANDGAYVDSSIPKNGKTFRYTVCETGTLFCSDEVTIRF